MQWLIWQSLWLMSLSFNLSSGEISWQVLDKGLEFAEVTSPQKSTIGDAKITLLKINPDYYDFRLVCASEKGGGNHTVRQWCRQEKLIAGVNAGMYQTDHSSNVGYMQNYSHINNSKVQKDYNVIAAFNRKEQSVPAFQIIDIECQDWPSLKQKYNSFSQSIRMMDCHQKNRWSQQQKRWSMVVLGKDKSGNALMIFTRSPYSVHDFINILMRLPLSLYNLMYLEGGPEASFYLNHEKREIHRFGSFETGFFTTNENSAAWPVPNVIGIVKKP